MRERRDLRDRLDLRPPTVLCCWSGVAASGVVAGEVVVENILPILSNIPGFLGAFGLSGSLDENGHIPPLRFRRVGAIH
jgi:hypothetical protein